MKYPLRDARFLSVTILGLAMAFHHSAPGATFTWTNAAGGDWNTPANWQNGAVPGAGDDAIINLAATNVMVTFSAGNSTLASIQCTGAFALSGGSITVTAGAS